MGSPETAPPCVRPLIDQAVEVYRTSPPYADRHVPGTNSKLHVSDGPLNIPRDALATAVSAEVDEIGEYCTGPCVDGPNDCIFAAKMGGLFVRSVVSEVIAKPTLLDRAVPTEVPGELPHA